MPNWGEVLQEITGAKIVSPVDAVRRKYLAKLNKYTGRNVIAYYSGWLQYKHIPMDDAISYGLKVKSLEDDQKLQDLVLTVHHAFMHTFSQANITKGIENHKGIGIFNFASRA